jgi:thiamine-phosphate pyrophosphorylase
MQGTYRVIDANINRAKEGLRVVEDICRFILDNEQLTDQVKNIRHQLTKLIETPDWLLVQARGSDEDVARGRDVPRRKSTRQVFTANMKRATEAARVLEEFCKNGNAIKDVRYALYDLEKTMYQQLRLKLPFEYDVYVVSDSVEVLKKAVLDGAAIVQLRDKQSSREIIKQKALELKKYQEEKEFIFILNDDLELAIEIGADGVHVGQDMPTPKNTELIVGKTTHNITQAKQAVADGANYISAGPVYPTPTKPGRPAVGLKYVREVATQIDIPFVTIGGIDLNNLTDVLKAGARTIGIVRAADQTPVFLEKIRSYHDRA